MRRTTQDERGFTIVEVLVASVILLVGIMGVVTIVNTANRTTTSNKAREQGLALARELVESARSVRYQALRPDNAVATVQNMPGLGNANAGSGWTIKRRGIVYSVSLGVCSVDDPKDGTGAHVANAFCTRSAVSASADTCATLIGSPAKISGAGGAGGLDAADCGLDTNLDGAVDGLLQTSPSGCPSGTSVGSGCDAQPDDFKRLTVLITWDRGSGNRYVLQQATESFPGLSAYAGINSLTLRGATSTPYVVTPDAGGNNVSSLTFDVTSTEPANQVDWLLNGSDQGQAAWSGTSGSFVWNLGNDAPASETARASGEVVDGSYTIGARVQDASGIHGRELSTTVTLNRRKPFAPTGFNGLATSGGVLLTWIAPPDQDLIGYEVHRWNGESDSVLAVCSLVKTTTCTDTNPPSSGSITYQVYAIDRDAAGNPRRGTPTDRVPVATGSSASAPATPTAATPSTAIVGTQGKNKVKIRMSWNAVANATSYGVWRDQKTGAPATVTTAYYDDTIFNTETHTYYIVAIKNGVQSGVLTISYP